MSQQTCKDCKVIQLIKELISFFEAALREVEMLEFEDRGWILDVCLDCRKFGEIDDPNMDCCVGHTLLEEEVRDGSTDVSGALRCLKWILKQVGGE